MRGGKRKPGVLIVEAESCFAADIASILTPDFHVTSCPPSVTTCLGDAIDRSAVIIISAERLEEVKEVLQRTHSRTDPGRQTHARKYDRPRIIVLGTEGCPGKGVTGLPVQPSVVRMPRYPKPREILRMVQRACRERD